MAVYLLIPFNFFYLQPNLGAYQKRKHAPKPGTVSVNGKVESEETPDKKPRQRTPIEPVIRTTSPLPTLPDDLLAQQRRFDQRSSGKRGTVTFIESPKEESDRSQDPLTFVEMVQSNPKIGFLYMSPAVEKSSIKYNPYNLRFVLDYIPPFSSSLSSLCMYCVIFQCGSLSK